MKKINLANGLVVVTRNGCQYLVCNLEHTVKFFGISQGLGWEEFSEDLLHMYTGDLDIMRVHKIHDSSTVSLLQLFCDLERYTTKIWERERVKEMTVAEISEALGYEVKVVK